MQITKKEAKNNKGQREREQMNGQSLTKRHVNRGKDREKDKFHRWTENHERQRRGQRQRHKMTDGEM